MSFSGADSMRKNVPTPHFGRRPGVDKIDELIEDTDKALKGLPSRLPPTGPDPKALKDAFLETSPSFQEMLQALEAFDAVAAAGTAVASKYEQALFAALRTMLRECLFTKNAGLRKHHIDRVYAWFMEKRSSTSQGGAAAGSAHEASPMGKHLSATAAAAPRRPPLSATREPAPFMSGLRPSTAPAPGGAHAPAAQRGDQEAAATPGAPPPAAARPDGGAPVVPIGAGLGPGGISVKERIKEYKMRNLRVSQMRRSGIPMQAIKAAQAAVDKMRTTTEVVATSADGLPVADDELDRKINELWLRKREEEEAERRSEQEVREAMSWWAHNRARIEEEIGRRQESMRFASKTALLHSRPATAMPSMAGGGRAKTPARLDDTIPSDSDDDEGVDVVEDLLVQQQLPEKFQKIPQLRSPYDGLRQSNTPAGWRADSPARPISARLAGFDRGGGQLLGSPMASGPLAFSRTADRPATAGARVSAYDDTLGLPAGKPSDPVFLHGFSSPHSRPISSYRFSIPPLALHPAPAARAALLPSSTPLALQHASGRAVPCRPVPHPLLAYCARTGTTVCQCVPWPFVADAGWAWTLGRMSAATTMRAGGTESPSLEETGMSSTSRPTSAYSAFQRTQQLSEVDRVKRAFAKSKLPCPLRSRTRKHAQAHASTRKRVKRVAGLGCQARSLCVVAVVVAAVGEARDAQR